MKKILCLVLLAGMLMTTLVGCGSGSGILGGSGSGILEGLGGENELSLSGIDAAKLLLAEERLNEKLLKNEGDIFEKGVEVMNGLADKAIANLGVTLLKGESNPPAVSFVSTTATGYATVAPLGLSQSGSSGVTLLGSLGEEKQNIGKMELVGDTVVWSDFGEVSNSYEYFLNLTNNIVSEAERCAQLIDFVKKNIRIVDQWVVIGDYERYYLSVGENEELLCNVWENGSERMLIICRRYRNEEGKDVYEMYRSYSTEYEVRMTYIPGERYELSENRMQYFVATNTKGYWENYVLGAPGDHYNTSYLIMKDDICYTFGALRDEHVAIDILSADRQTDLFHYSPSEDATSFTLKLNGFTNIEKITAHTSQVQWGENNDFAILQWGRDFRLHVKGGHIIENNQAYCDGKVRVSDVLIMAYSYGYGTEMQVRVEGEPEEALQTFKQFLTETGLGCSRDIDTVIAGTKKSLADARAVYNYYQWNGYAVNTEEGIRQGIVVEGKKYDVMLALYEGVKNAEVVDAGRLTPEELELHMSFAPIVGNASTGATMAGDKLTVESLTLTINDVLLFVEEEPYHVVVALEDSAGAIVHLEQTATGEVKYAGEKQFEVTVSNVQITLPQLTPGSYRVVAYIATSGGIRSSQFAAVKFESVEGTPVSLGTVDLDGSVGKDGVLTLTYAERVDVDVDVTSAAALTYAAFKQLVCEAAFVYGTPDEACIEQLVGDGYVALGGNESSIAEGRYRVAYATENGEYARSGYVYVTYYIKAE